MNEKTEFLKNVPIFNELHEPEIEIIASLGLVKEYKKGSIILLEDETGAALFVIISGQVKIVRMDDDAREVILSILGESDFFGEMALLDGLTRSATAVATSNAKLFMIHRKDFLKLLHDYPMVAIALLRELAGRLRKADAKIKSLSLNNAAGRVANVILQLADEVGIFRKGKVEIEDLPHQQEIANMAGTSRETTCRMLHKFMDKGHLQLQGSKLVINDYKTFKEMYI
jgi:CRP-like cAMP-binding protein